MSDKTESVRILVDQMSAIRKLAKKNNRTTQGQITQLLGVALEIERREK